MSRQEGINATPMSLQSTANLDRRLGKCYLVHVDGDGNSEIADFYDPSLGSA